MNGTATVNRRRSTRIQRAGSNRNGNGAYSQHSQSQSQRGVNHSNRSSNNGNGNVNNRYSGNKRRAPDESSDSSSDESSDESDESDYETSLSTSNNNSSLSTPFSSNSSLQRHRNNHNHNNNRNRRYGQSQYSQLTELAASQSQVQAQHAKRRRMQYQVQTQKWKQNQSNIERRSTRLRYRKLADDTHDNRAAIVDPMSNQFMDKLEEQNKIYEDVCHPNEAFMDIEQAKNMTNILKEQTRTLANEQFTITPQDYISAIIAEFGGNNNRASQPSQAQDDDTPADVNWAAIGQRFAPWFLTVPSIQFMNGPLQNCESVPAVQKKPRQVRQKKTFTTDAPMIQPKKVVKQKKADKTETKSRVTHLKKILRRKCEDQDGVNPFEFLINPHSYSQTVENLFDMSFIMKEGWAQMDVNNATEQPVLSYVSASERTRRDNLDKRKTRTNGQCIVKINPATFCNLIDVYDITQSQIERADANMSSEDESNSEASNDDEKSMSTDEESEEESEPEPRRRGLGRGRRGRGRGNKQANGHNNGRGRNVRNGRRRRNNDKEEAD